MTLKTAYVFSQHLDDAEIITKHSKQFQAKIEGFYKKGDDKDGFGGREIGKKDQEKRIELFEQLITEIIGSKHAV